MKKTEQKKINKIFKGVVVSDKMDKTVVAAVDSYKTYSKYLKKFKFTKKYKVHDNENKHKCGDKVKFEQCKPVSKGKRFKLV